MVGALNEGLLWLSIVIGYPYESPQKCLNGEVHIGWQESTACGGTSPGSQMGAQAHDHGLLGGSGGLSK